MNPNDPRKSETQHEPPPMAPPFVDENPERDLIQQGLDVAEDELRDAVTSAYEDAAVRSDDQEEALDEIDYEESQQEREEYDDEPGQPDG